MLQSRKKHLKEAHKISNKSSCLYSTPKTKKERILVCSSRVFSFFWKSKELLACTFKCIPFSNLIVLRFLNQPHFPQNRPDLPLNKEKFIFASIVLYFRSNGECKQLDFNVNFVDCLYQVVVFDDGMLK